MSRLGRAAAGAGADAAAAWTIAHHRSPAVRNWRRSRLSGERVGRLWCRSGGDGESGALLLHGLVATGDVFGDTADALATECRVVVPDLLGFGRSLDEGESDFGTEAHLAALDLAVSELLGDRPIDVVAHSMGSALALRWADRHPERVHRVVCIGAPMWSSSSKAAERIAATSTLARLSITDQRLAHRLCQFNCEHRTASGWLSAAVAPRWPIPIGRQASLHTWGAYQQTLNEQVFQTPWSELLTRLDAAEVAVHLVWGDRDPVGDPAVAAEAGENLRHVSVSTVPGADHTLPAARPGLIVDLLQRR